MSHENARKLKGVSYSLLLALALPLCACAEEPDPATKHRHPDQRYLPFAIKFDMKGAPVLVDEYGNPIKGGKLQYPIEASSIERLDTIGILQATGSHYKVIRLNNKEYMIPLPH